MDEDEKEHNINDEDDHNDNGLNPEFQVVGNCSSESHCMHALLYAHV